MSFDEHTIPFGYQSYTFVDLPDKKLSSTPNATSESYENDAMKSTLARLEGILNFNALQKIGGK